jgi:ubiquitin-like protein ATG12
MLKLTDADPLFLFVNNAFCPCPDERIKHLFECFQVSNELEVSYQIAGAWG